MLRAEDKYPELKCFRSTLVLSHGGILILGSDGILSAASFLCTRCANRIKVAFSLAE